MMKMQLSITVDHLQPNGLPRMGGSGLGEELGGVWGNGRWGGGRIPQTASLVKQRAKLGNAYLGSKAWERAQVACKYTQISAVTV